MNSTKFLNAILSEALYSYEFDVTTGIVEHDIIGNNGINYSKLMGISAPFSFDDVACANVVEKTSTIIADTDEEEQLITRDILLQAFEEGKQSVSMIVYNNLRKAFVRLTYYLCKSEEDGHVWALSVCEDVTDRVEKTSHAILQETTQMLEEEIGAYNNIHEALTSGAWKIRFDDKGNISSCIWSDKFRKMLGYMSEEEFPNNLDAWSEKLHPDDKEKTIKHLYDTINDYSGHKKYDIEYRLRMKSGEYQWFRAAGNLARGENGIPRTFDGLFVNMNERHLAQQKIYEALEEAERSKNEALLDNEIISSISKMYFAIFRIDLEKDFYEEISSDSSVHRLTGHEGKAQERMNILCDEFVMPEFKNQIVEFFDLSTVAERLSKIDTVEMEYHATDGRWHEARFIAKKRNKEGTVTHILYVTRLISKEKQFKLEQEKQHLENLAREREQYLKISEKRVSTMMEAIHGGFKISKKDPAFTFVMVSEQLAQLFGYDSVEELMRASGGAMAGIANHEDTAREISQAWDDVTAGRMYTMHYRVRCKDGSWKNIEDRGKLIRNDDGTEEFWSFIVDQDELVQKAEALEKVNCAYRELEAVQQELKVARDASDEANKAKTTFLLNMSHDIRTPMNAILGYSQLMKKGLTDPTMLHYQEKMEQASNFLLSLINNVLDMARIESGQMELDAEYIETGNIISGVLDVFEEQAKAKNLIIHYSNDVLNKGIICDRLKIQEIFTNIISNAIKYTTDGGTITIITKEKPCKEDDYAIVETSVEDTGIGMSAEFLPHIFDTFTRERNTTQGQVAGTGLGMPIVKKYVELMGGTIEVESELGKGSKFTVTLKHKLAPHDEINPGENAGENVAADIGKLAGKHILLAEDNELNAEIATIILEDIGLVVERVPDGVICVEKMEHQPSDTYDLILMDIQMPNMDGYKATHAIRRLPDQEKASIPIIAMTANAFEEDKREALRAGMNGHLAKPINVTELMKTLAGILG